MHILDERDEYEWVTYGGQEKDSVVLIAPSNGFADESGQSIIAKRIELLNSKRIPVTVPRYPDGYQVVQKDCVGRESSGRMGGTISPAVAKEVVAKQIIESIISGRDIMPLMGGDGAAKVVPIVAEYFKMHPEQKNPKVKIYGMSNSTFMTVLASRGICDFVATPFTSILKREREPEYRAAAEHLVALLRGERIEPYARRILADPDNKLAEITDTKHYPLNLGNVHLEALGPGDGRSDAFLHIERARKWSVAIEGFLQKPGNREAVDYELCLRGFLRTHRANPPQFIELGQIATRLDGFNGYSQLQHDENGYVRLNEANINKVAKGHDVSKAEACDILEEEIIRQEQVIKLITEIAIGHGIPVIFNPNYGHVANMSIVNGGLNEVHVSGDEVTLKMSCNKNLSPIEVGAHVERLFQ